MFVPPNPNELLKAYEIFFSCGILGIKLILLVSMGLFKFNVAGNILSFKERIEKIDNILSLDKSKFRSDLRNKIRNEIRNGLEKDNMINEEDKILIYKFQFL